MGRIPLPRVPQPLVRGPVEKRRPALEPKLVAEFEYDHFTNGRFRHGTRFVRWRPDKKPPQCTLDQLGPKKSPLAMLEKPKRKSK